MCWALRLGCLAVAMLAVGGAPAAVIGMSTPAPSISVERIAGLPRAQQAAWREYLSRSQRQMQADRKFLAAECQSSGAAETIPPNGFAARSMPLNRPAEWYGGEEARRIADNIVSFQTPAGGWSKNLNLADHARRPCERFAPNNLSAHLSPGDFDTPHDAAWNYVGTLDNEATTTELRFLARVAAAQKSAEAYRASLLRGIEYLLAAQFPNGGWPQVWPLEGGYHDAITFNDGAMTLTLDVLEAAAGGRDEFAFVPQAVRDRARTAVERGIRCILAAQIGAPDHRTVWAQQYDALDLHPVSARNYEPAVQCGAESAELLLFLMRVQHPDSQEAAAIRAAVAWFRKTAIYGKAYRRGDSGRRLVPAEGSGPIWARFYEIGTDRPVFGDRDKTIHDDVNEISAERRNGYSWYNAAPQEALDRFAEWSQVN